MNQVLQWPPLDPPNCCAGAGARSVRGDPAKEAPAVRSAQTRGISVTASSAVFSYLPWRLRLVALHVGEDVHEDHRPVQRGAQEDEAVPDLVVAELPGNRVRALHLEDDAAAGVGQAPDRQEPEAAPADEGEDDGCQQAAEPAQGDVHGHAGPFREGHAAAARRLHDHAEDGEAPAGAHKDPALPSVVEADEAHRRHRAGDQEVYRHVVQGAQQPHQPLGAADAVVGEAREEEVHEGGPVQGEAHDRPRVAGGGRAGDQDRGSESGKHAAHEVGGRVEDLVRDVLRVVVRHHAVGVASLREVGLPQREALRFRLAAGLDLWFAPPAAAAAFRRGVLVAVAAAAGAFRLLLDHQGQAPAWRGVGDLHLLGDPRG
mmetsp:Transcript_62560/g.183442  ORF Transcript_62560/g.183442 Transcript_62560/m.183442 type:complete len:373 (-) Transcript_62560:36-1154(-)